MLDCPCQDQDWDGDASTCPACGRDLEGEARRDEKTIRMEGKKDRQGLDQGIRVWGKVYVRVVWP